MKATQQSPFAALVAFALGGLVGCGDTEPRGTAAPTARTPSVPTDLPQGSDVAGWIEVTALHADGSPAKGADAYAVRVGRRSDVTTPDWPEADVGEDGIARIPLPAIGTYDVGVLYVNTGRPRALIEDVRVEAGETARVTVRLPALARIEVHAEGIDLARALFYAMEATAPGERSSYNPARGERNIHSWSQSTASGFVNLPEGAPHQVWISVKDEKSGRWIGDEWRADPAVVRAPGRVTFRREAVRAEPEIEIPIRFGITGVVPTGLRGSELRIWYSKGTPDAIELSRTLAWTKGKPEDVSMRILLGAKPAKITWFGDGVTPGELLLPGAGEVKTAVAPIELTIRADDLPFIEGVDIAGGRRPPRTDSPRVHATGPDPDDDADVDVDHWTDRDDRSSDLRPGWKAIAEWGAWWVSSPVTVPKRGRLKFELVPGGYLLATSSRVVTPGLGTLSIRRADGAWLGGRDPSEIANDDCWGGAYRNVRLGMILGPFPEGDVELVVSLGGEERVRLVGHVKANRITPFALTW